MSEATVAERVARGAEWLDRTRPGWVQKVDLDKLDIEYPSLCVTGQVFRPVGYRRARRLYLREVIYDGDLGFHAYGRGGAISYARLNFAWRRLIVQRLSLSDAQ